MFGMPSVLLLAIIVVVTCEKVSEYLGIQFSEMAREVAPRSGEGNGGWFTCPRIQQHWHFSTLVPLFWVLDIVRYLGDPNLENGPCRSCMLLRKAQRRAISGTYIWCSLCSCAELTTSSPSSLSLLTSGFPSFGRTELSIRRSACSGPNCAWPPLAVLAHCFPRLSNHLSH